MRVSFSTVGFHQLDSWLGASTRASCHVRLCSTAGPPAVMGMAGHAGFQASWQWVAVILRPMFHSGLFVNRCVWWLNPMKIPNLGYSWLYVCTMYIYIYIIHTYHTIPYHYITLHYITLHYITLHYIYTYIHIYIYTYIYIYIFMLPCSVSLAPPMVWVPRWCPSPSVLHAICSISSIQPRIFSISDFQRFICYLLEDLSSTHTPSKYTYS